MTYLTIQDMIIMDVIWFTPSKYIKTDYPYKHLGLIFIETPEKKREIYIGTAKGDVEKDNIKEVLLKGHKISPITLIKIHNFFTKTEK